MDDVQKYKINLRLPLVSFIASDTTQWGEIIGNITNQTDLIDFVSNGITNIVSNYLDNVNIQIDNITNEISTINSSIIDINNIINNNTDDINNLTLDVTDLALRITNAESNISTLTTNLSNVISDLTSLSNTVNNLSTDLTTTISRCDTLEDAVSDINDEITTINSSISTINIHLTGIQNSISTISTTITNIQSDITLLTNRVSTNETDISTIKTKLNTIETGAQVNVQSDWNETNNTNDAFIKNKPLRFATSWGMIDGNITNQTDLNNALNSLITDISNLSSTVSTNLSNLGFYVVKDISEDNTYINTTRLIKTLRNTSTGVDANYNIDLTLASATKSGIMPKESFIQIQANSDAIALLQNVGRRYPTSDELPDTLTQLEVLDIYQQISGNVNPNDGDTLVSLHINTKNFEWTYFVSLNVWEFKGVTSVRLATNSTAGIVQGENTNGKIFVENDGTMSLVGYDDLNTDISNLQSNLSITNTNLSTTNTNLTNLTSRVSTNETNIGTINTNITNINTRLNGLDSKTDTTNTNVSNLTTRVGTNETSISTINTKLNTIESGAQVNVQSDWDEVSNTSDAYILNKPDFDGLESRVSTNETNISSLDTKTDNTNTNLTNLTSRVSTNETDIANLVTKTDTTNTNLGITNTNLGTANSNISALTTRVSTNETNINNIQSSLSGGATLSNGLYKITTNSQGRITSGTAVAKSDITALGIPSQDTITSVSQSGVGNAVTDISGSNGNVVSVKGLTFVTDDRIQLVASLPVSPIANVLYLIPE